MEKERCLYGGKNSTTWLWPETPGNPKAKFEKIRELKKCYNSETLLSVYDTLSDNCKKLVIPEIISDEAYALQWQQEEYEGKEIKEGLYYTEKEEQVRSESEMILADRFTRNGIPYHYEYPVYLHGYGTVYPDFNVLNKRTRRSITGNI